MASPMEETNMAAACAASAESEATADKVAERMVVDMSDAEVRARRGKARVGHFGRWVTSFRAPALSMVRCSWAKS